MEVEKLRDITSISHNRSEREITSAKAAMILGRQAKS
jgi:hypothetical protein